MLFGSDGLISSVVAFKLCAFVGFVAATILVLLVIVRKSPELTTQLNRKTGKRETGLIVWALVFYGPLCLLPFTIAEVLAHPPLLALVIGVAAFGVYLKHRIVAARRPLPDYVPAGPPAAVQAPAYEAQPAPAGPTYIPTVENTYQEPDARYLTPFPGGTLQGPDPSTPTQIWGLDPEDLSSPWQRPATDPSR